MVGLALSTTLICLDATIIGTCGTMIARDLDGLELYAWMITSFLLCETAMIPISGKMSDRFGRRPIMAIGLISFLLGSVLAGLSVNMGMLIASRCIQGFGGGIIIPVCNAAVADLYAPEDRGKMQGLLGAFYGIGSGCGPLVGGFICNYATWHAVFYINVPLTFLCLLLIWKKLPGRTEVPTKKIDYLGMAVLTMMLTDLLLLFEWVGSDFEVISIQSLLMAAFAIIAAVVFYRIEKRAEDPVLAPKLFHNRTIVVSMAIMFLYGIVMVGTLSFIAMYMIYAYGVDTMECGLMLLPFVIGMSITSTGSGMLVSKTGYRLWVFVGTATIMASLLLMSTLGPNPDRTLLYLYTFLFGLGLGCVASVVMVAVQNAADPKEMGMTTSSVGLVRSVGATMGTSIFALIISAKMDYEFAASIFNGMQDAFNLHGTGLLRFADMGLDPGLTEFVIGIFGDGLCLTFLVTGIMFVVAIGLSLLIDSRYSYVDE